jgi:UDP-2,3-diacylglucosamine pyrophosphatase LpxH
LNLHKSEFENEEQYLWRLGQAKDNGQLDMNWNEIADIVNKELSYEDKPFSEAAFRKPYQQAKRFYEAGVFQINSNNNSISDNIKKIQQNYNTETTINKDGTYSSNKLLEMNETQSKDPEYILKAHGFDPNYWTIASARNNIRQAISRDEGVVTLYASFITVKPIGDGEIPLSKYEDFFNNLDRRYSLPSLKENYQYLNGNKLLLIDIADLHMNLQASMFTTGNEYNCDIAEKLFFYVIEDILTRTQNYNFEEIVFVVGGDMLNTDNLSGTTTRGTPQDNDIHYYDAYERLCAMTIKAIDILKEKCKVNVIYVMGNHDEVVGFKLAKYIDAWFRNEDRISVDYQPLARKYKLYGKTLMCFAHDGKVQKLPAIIADEARQYWSQAETTEVFLQHLHTEQVLIEDNNIRIQRLPTISGKSKWSSDKGYNSKRQCKTFVFDKEDGLTDVLYTPIRRWCFNER